MSGLYELLDRQCCRPKWFVRQITPDKQAVPRPTLFVRQITIDKRTEPRPTWFVRQITPDKQFKLACKKDFKLNVYFLVLVFGLLLLDLLHVLSFPPSVLVNFFTW